MSKQDETLKISADLWNSFLNIPIDEIHPDDTTDIRFHIHAIQNILYTQKYKNEKRVVTVKPKMPLSKVINETRQVGTCLKCNSSLIRKYWIYLWGKKHCINTECK